MKTTFSTAAVAGVVMASPETMLNKRHLSDQEFIGFMSNNNKHYTSQSEMLHRARVFNTNQAKIAQLNANAARSGKSNAARFGVNQFSDMTEAEFEAGHLGAQERDSNAGSSLTMGNRGFGSKNGINSRKGGLGVVDATTVDHVADGFMGAVKQQGNCGSCWAFAATSALEGYVAKSRDEAPKRMSEQQLVDCTLRENSYNQQLFGKDYGLWGCGGGWMDVAWQFQSEQGVMLNSDYPYTSGGNGQETQCGHDTSKTVGKVTTWGKITTSIEDAKAKSRETPMTIAINASGGMFQFYESGVVGANDGCSTQLNHAVVVVGYSSGDDTDPSPGPNPPTPEPTGDCTVTKWWHSCSAEPRNRHLADANGYNNYWKIQNSWGTGWGDNGFILFEIADGDGVCGMNKYIEFAEM